MYFIFDFDNTLITKLDIDYNKLKNKLKNILNNSEELTPLFNKINLLAGNNEIKKKCYNLIDKYENDALEKSNIKNDIIDLYKSCNYKFIVSRNGRSVIKNIFYNYNITPPDFISCRDNCNNLKPNTEQIERIFKKYKFLNNSNITIVGDSWHDKN